MAVALCPDLQAFMDIVDQSVDYVMEHEIADMTKSAISVMVEVKVYRAYTPKAYARMGEHGGLKDRDNMEVRYEKRTKTLTVQDVRDDPETKEKRWKITGDPENTVADVVENGWPYTWSRVRIGPRPFHKPAEVFLIQGGHVDTRLTQEMEANLSGWSY